MPDLNLLSTPLTSEGEPGLDTLDDRFQAIVGLVQNGQFMEAAESTEAVLKEKKYDVRLLGYFLYGIFLEQGVRAIGPIFESLGKIMTESWDAVGPERKKERHTQNGLLWFMTRLLSQLQHEQERDTENWQSWLAQIPPEEADQIGEKIDAFRGAISSVVEAPKVLEQLPKIRGWVTEFHKIVYQTAQEAAAQSAAEEAAAAPPAADAEAPEGGGAPAAAGGAVAPQVGPGSMVVPVPVVEGSRFLQELIDKLDAFEVLVEEDAFEKAAVIAADVNELIEQFDPRRYLPNLFSTYYGKLSSAIEEIEPHLDDRDSLKWQSMDQHYRVDLKSFIES